MNVEDHVLVGLDGAGDPRAVFEDVSDAERAVESDGLKTGHIVDFVMDVPVLIETDETPTPDAGGGKEP